MKNDHIYGSQEEMPKPPRRDSSEGILVLLLVLGTALIIFQVPSVHAYFTKMFFQAHHPSLDSTALVWTNKDAGVYYCQGGKRYGSGAGAYMKQGDALTEGYQPALGNYCSPGGKSVAKESAPAPREVYKDSHTSTGDGGYPVGSAPARR